MRGVPWGVEWDSDWDGGAEGTKDLRIRVVGSLRALRRAAEQNKEAEAAGKHHPVNEVEFVVPPGPRHLMLVRHGEYLNVGSDIDEECRLSDRGRQQAFCVGDHVAALMQHDPRGTFRLLCSDLVRAQETAALIGERARLAVEAPDEAYREGFPCRPSPCRPHVARWIESLTDEERETQPNDMYQAFLKLFGRPLSPVTLRVSGDTLAEAAHAGPTWHGFTQPASYWVLACHTNLIRFFTTCALQVPPEAWTRMRIAHGSITTFVVTWDGHVTVTGVSEQCHIPFHLQSV